MKVCDFPAADDPAAGDPSAGAGQKIAIFRATSLADLLSLVPTLRALRAAVPLAHISLVGLPAAAQFVARFPHYLDGHLRFPGFPGWHSGNAAVPAVAAFLHRAQQQHFDLALQLHGRGEVSNPLTAMLGARRTAGFYADGAYCPDPASYLLWSDLEADSLRGLRLLALLGVPERGARLEFPLTPQDQAAAARLAPRAPYACLHAGAGSPARRWLPQRFAAVGDWLAGQGLTVVLTGLARERVLTRAVRNAMLAPALDLTGRTGLGALAGVVAGARLVLANDSAVAQLAAALQVPSVVVCCGADPARRAPPDRQHHRLLYAAIACQPCNYEICPIGHPCATLVEAEAVIQQLREVLAAPELRRTAGAH